MASSKRRGVVELSLHAQFKILSDYVNIIKTVETARVFGSQESLIGEVCRQGDDAGLPEKGRTMTGADKSRRADNSEWKNRSKS